MDQRLKNLARLARREMKAFASAHPYIGDPADLCCYCAISSYFLKILAAGFGYDLRMVEGVAFDPWDIDMLRNDADDEDEISCNHCWLEWNGYIIDITATQFNAHNGVHIVKIGNQNYFAIAELDVSDRALSKSFREWPGEQSPVRFRAELKMRIARIMGEMQIAA